MVSYEDVRGLRSLLCCTRRSACLRVELPLERRTLEAGVALMTTSQYVLCPDRLQRPQLSIMLPGFGLRLCGWKSTGWGSLSEELRTE